MHREGVELLVLLLFIRGKEVFCSNIAISIFLWVCCKFTTLEDKVYLRSIIIVDWGEIEPSDTG